MGLFLSASGVLSPDGKAVRDAIAEYVTTIGGTFEPRKHTSNGNVAVIQSTEATTTVLYPDGFTEWDDLSKFLSLELKKPVFSFHIHDGDLWMFVAFVEGKEVAWFNPIPDYWEEVGDEERQRWSGDAESLALLIEDLEAGAVERYMIPWTEDLIGADQKSYSDDKFPIGVDWQLTDFMQRLGFVYPFDDSGFPTGDTFYLKIRRKRPLSGAPTDSAYEPEIELTTLRKPKSWWKFW